MVFDEDNDQSDGATENFAFAYGEDDEYELRSNHVEDREDERDGLTDNLGNPILLRAYTPLTGTGRIQDVARIQGGRGRTATVEEDISPEYTPPPHMNHTQHLRTNTPTDELLTTPWYFSLPDHYTINEANDLINKHNLWSHALLPSAHESGDVNPVILWFARIIDSWKGYNRGCTHIVIPEGPDFQSYNAYGLHS